jgi:hypothetical protein
MGRLLGAESISVLCHVGWGQTVEIVSWIRIFSKLAYFGVGIILYREYNKYILNQD